MYAFIGYKMVEGSYVSAHLFKMKAYTEQLSRLRFPFEDELVTDVILDSLPKSFNQFVLNFIQCSKMMRQTSRNLGIKFWWFVRVKSPWRKAITILLRGNARPPRKARTKERVKGSLVVLTQILNTKLFLTLIAFTTIRRYNGNTTVPNI